MGQTQGESSSSCKRWSSSGMAVVTKLQDFLLEYEEEKNPRKLVLKKKSYFHSVLIVARSFFFSWFEAIFASRIAENKKYFYLPKLIVDIPIQSLVVLQ